MIILNLYADNFYSFSEFSINFAYPKKIVNSTIDNEFLTRRPNFRYKKVNILMGANASGKTTLGELMLDICNFICERHALFLPKICDKKKRAKFAIDFVLPDWHFYRLDVETNPADALSDNPEPMITACVRSTSIAKNDDYESCAEKIDLIPLNLNKNYAAELESINQDFLGWNFTFPVTGKELESYGNWSDIYLKVLENILKSLDPSIRKVERIEDVEDSYVIWLKDMKLIMQKGKMALSDILSSGTAAGVEIAAFITNIIEKKMRLNFCDEKFSYINSEIEQAIISLMIDLLPDNAQLFITTHNSDVLEMNLPKHSFTFLRKDSSGIISAVSASKYLKKNSDSIKNAVINDVFSTVPRLDLINELAYLQEGKIDG